VEILCFVHSQVLQTSGDNGNERMVILSARTHEDIENEKKPDRWRMVLSAIACTSLSVLGLTTIIIYLDAAASADAAARLPGQLTSTRTFFHRCRRGYVLPGLIQFSPAYSRQPRTGQTRSTAEVVKSSNAVPAPRPRTP